MPDRHGLSKDEIIFPGKSDHFIQLPAVKGDGFFHKKMLAVKQSFFHKGIMGIVRTCNVDNIHIFVSKHFINF